MSAVVAARVALAWVRQRERAAPDGASNSAEALSDSNVLQADAKAFAGQAAERQRLLARGFTRILRVGRAIADLAGVDIVRRVDVAEALAYRHRVAGGANIATLPDPGIRSDIRG